VEHNYGIDSTLLTTTTKYGLLLMVCSKHVYDRSNMLNVRHFDKQQ